MPNWTESGPQEAMGSPGVIAALRLQRDGDVFDVEIRTADRTALMRKPRMN